MIEYTERQNIIKTYKNYQIQNKYLITMKYYGAEELFDSILEEGRLDENELSKLPNPQIFINISKLLYKKC